MNPIELVFVKYSNSAYLRYISGLKDIESHLSRFINSYFVKSHLGWKMVIIENKVRRVASVEV